MKVRDHEITCCHSTAEPPVSQSAFLSTLIGFNLTFMVQHVLGMFGMPRRVFTYPALPGWETMNMISTIGAFILGFSVVIFLVNVVLSLRSGKVAGDNSWGAPGRWNGLPLRHSLRRTSSACPRSAAAAALGPCSS